MVWPRPSLTPDPLLTYGFLTIYAISIGMALGATRSQRIRIFQVMLFLTAGLGYYAVLSQ